MSFLGLFDTITGLSSAAKKQLEEAKLTAAEKAEQRYQQQGMKKGGAVKKMARGGVAGKAPEGQEVPGTKTFHVDEPTQDIPKPTPKPTPKPKPKPKRAASAASAPEGQKVPGTETFHVNEPYAKGGAVKKMASGGSTSSRADGIAVKGKTKCKVY